MATVGEEKKHATSDQAPVLNKDVFKNDYYTLSSDFQGTTRLALQQHIWRQSLGFNIHPSVSNIPSAPSVADVAGGTGLWLVEVGRQLGPCSDLHGFDINLNQMPPKPWLPQNMTMHMWNMFDEVPDEHVGRFDLVHVRLISVAIKDNDPVIIIKNLCRLLKPGGYLQWDEVDVFATYVVKAYAELETPAMDAWCEWMKEPKPEHSTTSTNDWQRKVVQQLKANGFEAAERHNMSEGFLQHMELMRYNNDQLLMMCEQYARRVYAAGNEAGTRLIKIGEEAANDAIKGAAIFMPPFCWTARKAE